MEIRLKPIKVKLRERSQGIIKVTTPLAEVDVPKQSFTFITQGLAYDRMPVELDATRELQVKFETTLNSQLCLGHLRSNVSPFLYNYLHNKSINVPQRLNYESLISNLSKSGQRILFCGAGPSLYAELDFVRFCKETGYAIVVAGGSAIKALSNENIIPDLCLMCDPNPTVVSRGELPQSFKDQTILLAGSGVHPELFKNWQAPNVLTNGMSAFPMGPYLEPNKPTVSEGGIGVSTFVMNLAAKLPNIKELLILGVDLGSTQESTIYPDSLGFDNSIDPNREMIWRCEAQALGTIAASSPFKVLNLSKTGRNIPNCGRKATNDLVIGQKVADTVVLNVESEGSTEFTRNLIQFHQDLSEIDLTNVTASPVYKPFLEIYHNVYMSRMLYTGEYAQDSMVLKLEYLKQVIDNLILLD